LSRRRPCVASCSTGSAEDYFRGTVAVPLGGTKAEELVLEGLRSFKSVKKHI